MLSHGSRRTGRKNGDSRKDAKRAKDMVINSKHEIRNSKQIQMLKKRKALNRTILDKMLPSPIPMGEG
jgi:hypothetical protein